MIIYTNKVYSFYYTRSMHVLYCVHHVQINILPFFCFRLNNLIMIPATTRTAISRIRTPRAIAIMSPILFPFPPPALSWLTFSVEWSFPGVVVSVSCGLVELSVLCVMVMGVSVVIASGLVVISVSVVIGIIVVVGGSVIGRGINSAK